MSDLRKLLTIDPARLTELNELIMNPACRVVDDLLKLVEKFGGPEAINRKAEEVRKPESLKASLKEFKSPYLADIEWLEEQRDKKAFVSMGDYCAARGVDSAKLNMANAVTMEISALQFFPWVIAEAKKAIENRDLMPGRFIRVRNMAEQSQDQGDLFATALAMQIIGASYVETLDTKGTDGGNVHLTSLHSTDTMMGHFTGIGQPNQYPLKWIEEFLNYYTTCGVRQVLNVNAGTILLGEWLHKLGVDNEFKISVFYGIDNPWAILQALAQAKLLSRPDGTTSLIGFNFSNSVNNETILIANDLRAALGLTDIVRFEHHITEPYMGIVRQPYLRREELLELARKVPNIAAKHEGGDPEDDKSRAHISDIREYFIPKKDILAKGLMDDLLINYLDKHVSLNRSCEALIKDGTGVICAANLH